MSKINKNSRDDELCYWYDGERGELVLEEDDQEYRFYLQDKFSYEGQEYCILSPSEDKKEQLARQEALLMKIIRDNEEEMLAVIEDDEEFDAVSRHYYLTQSGEK